MKRLALLMLAACGTAVVPPALAPVPIPATTASGAPRTATTTAVASAQAPVSTTAAAATVSPTAVPAHPDASAVEPAASATPLPPPPLEGPAPSKGTVRCGEGYCPLPGLVCCQGQVAGEGVATCGPFMGRDWATLVQGCAMIEWVDRISHCDSAEDCGRGEVCCTDFTGEVESMSVCKPLPASGESPCTIVQRCLVEGKRCRQRNAVCRQGSCMRSDVSVDCGKAGRCRGSKPLCCVEKGVPRCMAPGACSIDMASGMVPIECDSAKDCLRGQECCRSIINDAVCTGFCPYAHATFGCQTDRDCPTKDPAWPHCVHEPDVINGKCEPKPSSP